MARSVFTRLEWRAWKRVWLETVIMLGPNAYPRWLWIDDGQTRMTNNENYEIAVALFVTLTIKTGARSTGEGCNDDGHTGTDGSLLATWIHYDNHRDGGRRGREGEGRSGCLVYAKQLLDPINVPSRHPPIDTSGLFGSSIIVIKISKVDEQRRDSRKLRVWDWIEFLYGYAINL